MHGNVSISPQGGQTTVTQQFFPKPQQATGNTKVVYSRAVASNQQQSPRTIQKSRSPSPRDQMSSPYNKYLSNNKHSSDLQMDYTGKNHNYSSMNEDISVSLNQKLVEEYETQPVKYPPTAKKQQSASIEQFDLKQFRLVASDFLLSPILQNLFAKLWKLMVSYNYEREKITMNNEMLLQIPLRIEIYSKFEPLFQKGLGSLYQTSQFVCSHATNYPHSHVLFQRFCFDFISFSGLLLYQLTLPQYEHLVRKVFSLITFYNEIRSEICFKSLEDIGGGIHGKGETSNVITKDVLLDITTTQWKTRKAQIKEEFVKSLAQEHVIAMKMKQQIERAGVEGDDDASIEQYDSLINLSNIADKARDLQLKREQRLRMSHEKAKPIPFMIESAFKEDLNIVLYKDLAGQGKLMDATVDNHSRQTFYQLNGQKPFNQGGRIPHRTMTNFNSQPKKTNPSQTSYQPQSRSSALANLKTVIEDQQEETLKAVLMYKQFSALGKNKDEESDTEEVKDVQRLVKETKRKIQGRGTPELCDTSSETDGDEEEKKYKREARCDQSTTQDRVYNTKKQSGEVDKKSSEQDELKEPSIDPATNKGQDPAHKDDQYIKYVWNKKTKRLEKRDIRDTATLNQADQKKFEVFSKVNQKSKILCMQLQENYFNSTLLPQAIAGEGEVNYKEIQEQMIYGPNDQKMEQGYLQAVSPMKSVLDRTYQQMPVYKKHMVNTQASKNPSTNLMNRKRRLSIEVKAHKDIYAVKPGGQPILEQVKQGQDKLILQPADLRITDQEVIDKKLAVIRMALRGGSLVDQHSEEGDDYQNYLQSGGSNYIREHQSAVTTAAAFNRNQAFFNQAQTNMGATATSLYTAQQNRAQSLLETRDLFMRNKIHAVQQTNKKLIQTQREYLKSSMQQSQNSYNKPGDLLPQLEATQARIYMHPNMQKPGKYTSPSFANSANRTLGRITNMNIQQTPIKDINKTPTLGGTNVSVRLKIQNATAHSSQKGTRTRSSVQQKQDGVLGSSGMPNSPRSSNNNMDIIEYGVLTLNRNQLIQLQSSQNRNSIESSGQDQGHGDQVVTGQENMVPLNVTNNRGYTSIMQKNAMSKTNTNTYMHENTTGQSSTSTNRKSKERMNGIHTQPFPQVQRSPIQGIIAGEGKLVRSPMNANQFEDEDYNDPLLMNPSQLGHSSGYALVQLPQSMIQNKAVVKNNFSPAFGPNSTMGQLQIGNRAAFINQLPMQDFCLEEWRTAYKNINSATRHFYTGSSYPAIVKL